jgi:uncharacterized membrane protein YuzA (DUF378 family)
MVAGMMLSAVLCGVLAAMVAVLAGHAPVSVALAYCLAGMTGVALFALAAPAREPAVAARRP